MALPTGICNLILFDVTIRARLLFNNPPASPGGNRASSPSATAVNRGCTSRFSLFFFSSLRFPFFAQNPRDVFRTVDIICQHCRNDNTFSDYHRDITSIILIIENRSRKCEKKKKERALPRAKSYRYISAIFGFCGQQRYFAHVIASRCNRRKDIKRCFLPARNVNTSVKRRGCFARIRLIPANTRRSRSVYRDRATSSLFRGQKLCSRDGY